MVWLKDDGLLCDVCAVAYVAPLGSDKKTFAEAERLQWKVADTLTFGGQEFHSHVCPECARVVRPPKVERLEGEEPLF